MKMQITDESKYSISEDYKYSLNLLITTILFNLSYLIIIHINHDTNYILTIPLVSSLIALILLYKYKSYPSLYTFISISILFACTYIYGIENRAPLIFLTLFPLYLVFYLYMIKKHGLDTPNSKDYQRDTGIYTYKGSISGYSEYDSDLRSAQAVTFSKMFLIISAYISLFVIALEIYSNSVT